MGDEKSGVLVGRIGGAYGIKGWVHVHSFTDPAENIFGYTPWNLHAAIDGSLRQAVEIVQGRPHGKGLIVQLEGVSDRDEAESLKGLEIRVARAHLPEPPGGQYYWTDLEGLAVVDESGHELGHVDHMLDTGSADVMVVVGEARHLIPFIYGESVLSVDLEAGIVRVDWDIADAE